MICMVPLTRGALRADREDRTDHARHGGLLGLATGAGPARQIPHLEIISVFGVGYDGMPLAACAEAKVKVTNTPDVLNDEVAIPPWR